MAKMRYFLLSLSFMTVLPAVSLADTQNPGVLQSPGEIKFVIDGYEESVPKDVSDTWITQENIFSLSQNGRAEFENVSYCPVDSIFCDRTLTSEKRHNIVLVPQTSLNEKAIRSYLEDLARKVNRDPEDAKFKIENERVVAFSEAKNGMALDVEKSTAKISEAIQKNELNDSMELPFETKKPAIEHSDADKLGIKSLIGKGTSDFKGSSKNRIYNIKVATQRFNGTLIKPGEEFSFVKILGEVDEEHGYLPELVIKHNRTEPEFGGGVCQVSTTAFRAAIYSGLKITARRNHAYPVSYYNPQGMDATVYVPNPDLRFINNTPGHILIQTKIEGTKLEFDFYGTEDGRKVIVEGPRITERQPDGATKTTFSQKVISKDGEELISDVFNSAYDSPHKYPHPGGPVLTEKPSNWSKKQWKEYQNMIKEMNDA